MQPLQDLVLNALYIWRRPSFEACTICLVQTLPETFALSAYQYFWAYPVGV